MSRNATLNEVLEECAGLLNSGYDKEYILKKIEIQKFTTDEARIILSEIDDYIVAEELEKINKSKKLEQYILIAIGVFLLFAVSSVFIVEAAAIPLLLLFYLLWQIYKIYGSIMVNGEANEQIFHKKKRLF